ncbi:MAG: dihydrolipoyl dehydrogenase, partial [Acidobacteriota bacterium]|nr:dihydrolipoyl dehydrogenase [Acidobacteriota bacterium]
MAEQFDVVIIGSGPGGYVAAVRGAQVGLKVAIIEKEAGARLGGTCGLRGCIPTKALLNAAHLYEKAGHFENFGIKVENLGFDWTKVQKYKSDVVAKNSSGVSYLMKKNKVTVFNGFGKITGKGKIEVAYEDGKSEAIDTKNIIIATGSVVRPIPGFEVDGKQVVNSDQILELTNVPKSMVVLGSGAVGVEFASVYARFGCETTVVELLDRIVPLEDAEVSKELARVFKKNGITCLTGVKMDKLEKTKKSVKLSGKDAKGNDIKLEAEMLLVAIGRMPYLENLGLENTKVVVNPRGTIKVNEYCETDEPNIFAIGDVIDTAWLAHLASKEGILVVEKLAGKKVEPINQRLVPNCTYCDPEVASVGLTEAKAREEGYDVKVGKFPFSASGKARILGETDGFVKIVSEKKYDEVLGVHIIGPHATELLAEACVAMSHEATAESLSQTIHAHPTVSESIMEAAEGVH